MHSRVRGRGILILLALIAATSLVLLYDYVNSPEYARNKAVASLTRGDSDTLFRMASRDEVERCHWTEDKVTTLLRDAPTKIDQTATPEVKMEADFPVDRRTWSYTYPTVADSKPQKIYVSLLHYKGQGWRPLLSGTMRGMYRDIATYEQKCRQLDIPGTMDDYGEFHPWNDH